MLGNLLFCLYVAGFFQTFSPVVVDDVGEQMTLWGLVGLGKSNSSL